MDLSNILAERSNSTCELCESTDDIQAIIVSPKTTDEPENHAVVCSTCLGQIEGTNDLEPNHWRCLNESMWSEVPAVQVLAHRMLRRLNTEGWAQDLLGMMYVDEATLAWSESDEEIEEAIVHKDSNGHILNAGDSVVLIKDLKVKGANFVAKRGTTVRRISLDPNNANHIEGRVEDQHIVILTQYVKKT